MKSLRELRRRRNQEPEIHEIELDEYVTPEQFERCLRHIAQVMVERVIARRLAPPPPTT